MGNSIDKFTEKYSTITESANVINPEYFKKLYKLL